MWVKWVIVAWLLAAGGGLSYSVVTERKTQVQLLKEMEHSLKRLAYYMYQWRMPIKEAIEHVSKEESGALYVFYLRIWNALTERQTEDFGRLWKEESQVLWYAGARKVQELQPQEEQRLRKVEAEHSLAGRKFPEEIKVLWSESFAYIPMEPEALNRRLLLRAEEIGVHRAALEEKYKGEQRLVFTMGFFVSAFFCLILW